MTYQRVVAVLAIVTLVRSPAASRGATRSAARTQAAPTTVDWPLHNLDLAGSRYSALDRINRSTVKSLVPRWLFQHGVIDGVSNQTTPIVVGGTMYVTDSRGSVYAVDAADGHLLWSYDVTAKLGGGALVVVSFDEELQKPQFVRCEVGIDWLRRPDLPKLLQDSPRDFG